MSGLLTESDKRAVSHDALRSTAAAGRLPSTGRRTALAALAALLRRFRP